MSFTYTPNVPQVNQSIKQTQFPINSNFQYLLGVSAPPGAGLLRDHNMTLNSGNISDGTHKQVTFNANLDVTPSLAGGVATLFTKADGSGNPQLFWNNGGTDQQLTFQNEIYGFIVAGSMVINNGVTQAIPNVPNNVAGTGYLMRSADNGWSVSQFIAVAGLTKAMFVTGSSGIGSSFEWIGGGPWTLGIRNTNATQTYHYVVQYYPTV